MQFAPQSVPRFRTSVVILVFALVIIGCRPNPPANQQNGKPAPKALSAMSDEELLDLVETFSTDVGEDGEDAWKQLQSYSRQELIDRVTKLDDEPDQDDFVRTNIASLMCNLDQ